jgi:hypothetical protein
MPRMTLEQRAPVVERVALRRPRQLVDQALHHERGVAVPHRAQPEHRDRVWSASADRLDGWATDFKYGESDTPSTEVLSTPFRTIIGWNGVPAAIDWPTIVCDQATGMPSGPTAIRARCRNAGR